MKYYKLLTQEGYNNHNKDQIYPENFVSDLVYDFPEDWELCADIDFKNIKRKLINSIHVNKGNFDHIANTGNINGTLYIEIERIMDEYLIHFIK